MTPRAGQDRLAVQRGLLLLAFLFALAVVGCEKESVSAKPATRPSVAGASPEHYLTTMPDASVQVPLKPRVAPATKPTSVLPPGTSCITAECHATFASAPHIHGPVSKGACDTCHADDAGGHKFPLKQQGNANCTFCHTVVGSASHQHKAVEIGCTSCHQPHVSNAKFLLKQDTLERTCAACHETPLKKHAHDPFAKGECTLCHQPHEADNVQLLRGGAGAKHCFTCHTTLEQTFKTAPVVHDPAKKQCGLCHGPHATDFAHQLKKPVDQTCYTCHEKIRKQVKTSPVAHQAVTTQNQCANCHDPHAAAQPGLLKHRTDEMCLTCHTDMKKKLASSQFLHGPNRAGNCSACHDPHGGTRSKLLTKPFPESFYARFDLKKYELCFTCHEPQVVLTAKTDTLTNFRDGDVNLHFVHVNRDDKGRSCRSCHDVHASNLPKHMASEVPFEGSNWSMPVGFQQTADGGTCAPGCHTPREYKRSKMTSATTKPANATTRPTTRGVS